MSGVPTVVDLLTEALGVDAVSVDPAALAASSHDCWPVAAKWARQGRHPHMAQVIVNGVTEQDVVTVMRIATITGTPVTARALGSSVTGQPLPTGGGIVLDVSGMVGPLIIDEINMTVTVLAGNNRGELEDALNAAGWTTLYRSKIPRPV